MTHIITPQGVMPVGMVAAHKAVRDYDPTLTLGRMEATGEWVVFKTRGPNGYPHPVFSLGTSPEPPSREVVLEKLSRADVRRRGAKIIADIERVNEARRRELRHQASEATGEYVELLEHATRKERGVNTDRIYLPAGVKSVERP